jgi:hypothetical protein
MKLKCNKKQSEISPTMGTWTHVLAVGSKLSESTYCRIKAQ